MIPVGANFSCEEVVTPQRTAASVGSGLLPVYGTPYMLALMENAAQSAIAPFLEEGRGSVGTHLDVFHNAPTPIGMTVRAEAEVVSVSENGKMIDFIVRAWDDAGPIGEGKHTRAIIHNERFLAKCSAKLEK